MSATASIGIALFEINLDGSPLAGELHQRIIEVRVEQALSLADRLILRFADPELELIDGKTIDVGHGIEVRLGPPDGSRPSEVFTGEVVSCEAHIVAAGAQLEIVALDKSHRLRRSSRMRAFRNFTVSDIARKVASENGLKVGKVEAAGSPYSEVFQHGESDWALLERLCDSADCDVDIDGGQLQILKRQASGQPVAELTIGQTLRSFRPRLSGVAQVTDVEVRSWDPTNKRAITERATPSPPVQAQTELRNKAANALGGGEIVIVDHPAQLTAHAKTMAQSAADRLGSNVVEARGVAVGDPRLRPGAIVSLDGVGRRFGGHHRIVAVTHVHRGGRGYETQFTVGAGGRPLVEEFGGRRRAPGFAAHLAIGLVTQNRDPEGQGRIKLKYPALDEEVESDWVRVAWPAAGNERGIVALPEIGDEVAVGFEHGDIERPLVLGVLFNGRDRPGEDLVAESSSIAVQMPRDFNTGVNGRVTTYAKAGIAMSSEGKVDVQTKGELQISSEAPLQITSQATAKLSAAVTTIQSQGEATVSANGAITISSNGALTIKGSAIQIEATGLLQLAGAQVILG